MFLQIENPPKHGIPSYRLFPFQSLRKKTSPYDSPWHFFRKLPAMSIEQHQPPIHRNSTAQGGQAMRQRQQLSSHLLQSRHVPHPADAQAAGAIGLAMAAAQVGKGRENEKNMEMNYNSNYREWYWNILDDIGDSNYRCLIQIYRIELCVWLGMTRYDYRTILSNKTLGAINKNVNVPWRNQQNGELLVSNYRVSKLINSYYSTIKV